MIAQILAAMAAIAPQPAEATCLAERAIPLMGRTYDEDLRREARAMAGHESLRFLMPGSPVTMDYVPQRLNLEVDRNGRIVRARCG